MFEYKSTFFLALLNRFFTGFVRPAHSMDYFALKLILKFFFKYLL